MKIGIAGPVVLDILSHHFPEGVRLPTTYRFAPMATWIEELLRRGHTISVFTLSSDIDQPAQYSGHNITVHVGRYRKHGRARDFFQVERQDLVTAMKEDPSDIIHAHWTYEFALAALDSGQPTLVTAHDAPLHILRLHRHPYRLVHLVMAMEVARRATHMTAVSPYIADHFRRYLRYRGQLEIVPNGIPPFVFDIAGDAVTGSPEHGMTFATVLQGWAGLKNGQRAVEAFQAVRNCYPDSRLMMFGEDHQQGGPAEQWAVARGLADGVTFVGPLLYLALLRRLAEEVDVLVHPSLEESFSMAIAEAMALGIPAIGGKKSGAVPYVVEDGRTGLLVDVRRSSELAAAMLKLVTDDGLRRDLGRTARAAARTRFNLTDVFDQYERLYSRVINDACR